MNSAFRLWSKMRCLVCSWKLHFLSLHLLIYLPGFPSVAYMVSRVIFKINVNVLIHFALQKLSVIWNFLSLFHFSPFYFAFFLKLGQHPRSKSLGYILPPSHRLLSYCLLYSNEMISKYLPIDIWMYIPDVLKLTLNNFFEQFLQQHISWSGCSMHLI